MKYLIDTHTFLWAISDKKKLSESVKNLFEDVDNALFISSASLWEIAIKISIGKLRINGHYEHFVSKHLALNQISVLSESLAHYAVIADLPFYHKDPFDRLIIAQSIVDNLPIISLDSKFDLYSIQRIW